MHEQRFAYTGPDEWRPIITQALERVVDPEVALNIVDVGLVYGVRVLPGGVEVDVTMTSAACPVAGVIIDDIKHELDRALPGDWKIHVDLVWEPPWSADKLSPKAKAFMGW